jgi:hypothetical protein
MTTMRRTATLGWLAALTACFLLGSGPDSTATTLQEASTEVAGSAARDPRIPPRKRKKLLAWLLEGSYRDEYVAEPAVHTSLGPHGGSVRTYYNSILVDDLNAGRTTWSKGAAMVKELYFSGTEQVIGYAVMIKVKANSGPNGGGWIFYETFDSTGQGAYYGRGLRLCASCHEGGTDYLLSAFRPE